MEEKCGMGCGRAWNEEGGKDGFEDCVSAYHKKETAVSSGVNENGGKEYRMKADVGNLFEIAKKLDMNLILDIAKKNGFVADPILLQTSMGVLNVPAWQKDVMNIKFWDAITKALGWDADTAMTTAMRFFELCMVSGWEHAVEYLSALITQAQNG